MASLADISSYASLPATFGSSQIDESDAGTEAGLQANKLQHLYNTRTIPAIRDRYASRGTFYSGSAGVAADRAREDLGYDQGDIQRTLTRTVSQLTRNRVLAAAGLV